MPVVTTAIATSVVGGAVASATIKYSESYYKNKIEELDKYYNQLQKIVDNLETKKNQIPVFWSDETGAVFMERISIKIRSVRAAMSQIDSTRHMYTNIMNQQKRTAALVKTSTDSIGDLKTGLEGKEE